MDVKDNKIAKAALNKVTRHLKKSAKVKLAKWVRGRELLGYDHVAIMDIMAARVGIDPYNDVDWIINNDNILMMGLKAWTAKRSKNNTSDSSQPGT